MSLLGAIKNLFGGKPGRIRWIVSSHVHPCRRRRMKGLCFHARLLLRGAGEHQPAMYGEAVSFHGDN